MYENIPEITLTHDSKKVIFNFQNIIQHSAKNIYPLSRWKYVLQVIVIYHATFCENVVVMGTFYITRRSRSRSNSR